MLHTNKCSDSLANPLPLCSFHKKNKFIRAREWIFLNNSRQCTNNWHLLVYLDRLVFKMGILSYFHTRDYLIILRMVA